MKFAELTSETLGGRFYLNEEIGRGGCGVVFKATQLSVDRTCAVKIISPNLVSDKKTIKRFQREARTTSKLSHPNSIVVYDFGFDEKRSVVFIAMEYLDGSDLDEYCALNQVDLELASHFVKQAAASLSEAHDSGLIHRDIKPSNLVVLERPDEPHFLKVIDFGIAKVLRPDGDSIQRLTQSGAIIGTAKCMAPEQIRNRQMDGRTDMYALATTVYQMLAGRPPFVGGTIMEIASQQLHDSPPPLSHLSSHPIPKRVDSVLHKALAKDRRDRFTDILSFANALDEAVRQTHSMPITSLDKTEPLEETPTGKKQRSTATSLGGIVALAVAALGLAIWFNQPNFSTGSTPNEAQSPPKLELAEPNIRIYPMTLPLDQNQQPPGPDSEPTDNNTGSSPADSEIPVNIRIIPWGTLFINGDKIGDKIRQTIQLPPGTHEFAVKQKGETEIEKTVRVSGEHPRKVELVVP